MKGWRRKSATGVLAKVVEVTADMERAERGGDGGGDGDGWATTAAAMGGRRVDDGGGEGGRALAAECMPSHSILPHSSDADTSRRRSHCCRCERECERECVSESVSENGVHKGLGVVGFGDTHTPHTHSVKRTVSNPQLLRGVRRRRTITLLPIDLAPL